MLEALTWQNARLLLRILGQCHLEVNRHEHEEEERNNHANGHYCQEDKFQGG